MRFSVSSVHKAGRLRDSIIQLFYALDRQPVIPEIDFVQDDTDAVNKG